jgi:hypothetical protein
MTNKNKETTHILRKRLKSAAFDEGFGGTSVALKIKQLQRIFRSTHFNPLRLLRKQLN